MKRPGKDTVKRIGCTLGWLGLLCSLMMLRPGSVNLNPVGVAAAQATGVTIYAVTTGNNLVSFNSTTPGTLLSMLSITGLQSGEMILGIDVRPRTGQLFALGSTSRLYTINTATGAATQVGTTPFTPALNGTAFGFDFDPVPEDRIRVVSDADQNLRLNPGTGAVSATDTMLAYATGDVNAGANPSLVGAAHTNNTASATVTTLFGIDANLDVLVRQGSPDGVPISANAGQLITIGSLGVNTTADVGFDIAAQDGVAFASLATVGATASSLYTINLTTGAATLVGAIGGTELIRDVAVSSATLSPLPEGTIFAVTTGNNLVRFNSTTPGTLISTIPITGLQSGETILGIDSRSFLQPQLFALGSTSRLYTINTVTGAAVQVGTILTPTLNGTAFGFDLDPILDNQIRVIRVVSDADQNLRLNSTTGAVAATDTTLAYATGDVNAGANPNIVGAAYTNSLFGATVTTLFGIDANLDILVRQGSPDGTPISPNAGQLFTVGSLGVNTTAEVGFDIAAQDGVAFASLTPVGAASSSLYMINLTTGAATLVGTIGGTELIRDVALLVPGQFVSVSGASFSANSTLARESIASGFGSGLSTTTTPQFASTIPLPTSLAGTTVRVQDSAGVERLAPLFFVGPMQVNYQIPPGTLPGMATVTVVSGNGTVSAGIVQVVAVAPGVFSANANGQGVAAAVVQRIRGGVSTYESVSRLEQGVPIAVPIDLGPETDQVYLLLYGTGIRFRSSLAAVTCQIGGTSAEVSYAGALGQFVGLEQINVFLSRSLIGRGEVDVVLTVDGLVANTVRINIAGAQALR